MPKNKAGRREKSHGEIGVCCVCVSVSRGCVIHENSFYQKKESSVTE